MTTKVCIRRSRASLLLRRVRDEEKGLYTLRYANALVSGSFNFDLRVLRKKLFIFPG